MTVTEALRSAVWSLLANPLRSFLTLLGIIIGITSIVAVIAVINGLDLYVEENLSNLGPGVFVVNKFGIITNRDEFFEALRHNQDLDLGDARVLRDRMTLSEAIGTEVHARAEVSYRENSVVDVDIGGTSTEILEIEPYDLAAGRILTPFEVEGAAPVVFLGHGIAETLFPLKDPLGEKVQIRGRRFDVVGVAKKRGSVFGVSRDNFVKIPITTYHKIFGSDESINISVKARDKTRIQEAIDQARVILRAKHHLDYDEKDDFGITSSEGINDLWKSLTQVIFQVAIFVVGISLVVGGIGIMNIMLVTVIERTREIGLRKAVGARQRDIRLQFLVESVVLSCLGGLIGITLAYGISWSLATFTPLPARFPAWAPLLAFTICSAIGVFFGLKPAAKAARMDPIEALHSE